MLLLLLLIFLIILNNLCPIETVITCCTFLSLPYVVSSFQSITEPDTVAKLKEIKAVDDDVSTRIEYCTIHFCWTWMLYNSR